MKRIIPILIIALMGLIPKAEAQKVEADLKVDTKIYDFGTIDEAKGKVSHTFRLTNTGSRPIVIVDTRTGCNCVSAKAPTAPIGPGRTADLTVTYDPAGRGGSFRKEIAIVTHDKKFIRVQIKGNVKSAPKNRRYSYTFDLGHGLLANYNTLDFGTLKKDSSHTLTLRFTNDCPLTMNLTFAIQQPDPDISVSIPYSCILVPDREDSLPITVTVKRPFKGTRTLKLLPIVNTYTLNPVTLIIRSK